MRFRTLSFVGAGFIFLLLCISHTSQARVSVSLRIGTSFGHRYPGYCYGYHPYSPWSGGYYSWMDRDRYRWWDTGRYRHFPRRRYWPGHSRSSRLGVWIGDYYPGVVDTPVLVRHSSVGTARNETSVSAKVALMEIQRREALERKKSEQIKILKSGDKVKRIQAIHDLAPFSYDNGIRQALAIILLSDPDPEVRKEVAVSFGRTENRLVLAALTEAKEKDPVRDVRQAAYRAIIMIKGY